MVPNPAPDPEPGPITLTCDGKAMHCRPGLSLAVALWDNGLRHLSHSHKYGRPRGVTCARGHCTNCLMRVDGVPNVRTCETTVRDGMTVATQDTGTFYGAGMQKLLQVGSAWVPVGFYYKWFTRPATLSRFFLERIRPMTGVGRLPQPVLPALPSASPLSAASSHLGRFATVVVGAGPSGLQAAARAEGRTLLVDDCAQPGGHRRAALEVLADDKSGIAGRFPLLVAAHERLSAAARLLADRPDVQFLGAAKAVAGYHPDGLLVRQGDRLQTVRFDRLVWAAGALDTFGLFPGNDTPGLLGPRALYRLLTRDGLEVRGRHALLVGGGLDFWLSAVLLASRGANLDLVVTQTGCQSEVSAAIDLGWPLHSGLRLAEVKGTSDHRLQATFLPRRNSPGPQDSHLHLTADLAIICRRGKPAYDIPYQVGADLELVTSRGGFVPRGCEASDAATFAARLPGGADLTFTGEALGLLPTEQVTR